MQVTETTISEFKTGQGVASGVKAALGTGRLYKGVRVHAPISATMTLYVGPSTMSAETGYEVPPGSDVLIEIDDLSKVFVVGDDSDAPDAEQTVVMTGIAPGDVYRLTVDGETTDWLWAGEETGMVTAALEALSTIGEGNVDVTGTSLLDGALTLAFQGDLAGLPVPLVSGQGGTCEVQEVGIDGSTTDGHFHLTFDGETTNEIAFNAVAVDVEAALEALSNIGDGNVEVSGGPGPGSVWSVRFRGDLAAQNVAAMTGDGTALVGGTSTDVTVTVTTPGESKTVVATETQAGGVAIPYSWIAQ